MNIFLRYALLSIFCAHYLCAYDQASVSTRADNNETQNAIYIKSAVDIAQTTDGVFLNAAAIDALESETIQDLLWFESSELCNDQGIAEIDLSRFFETPDQVTKFIGTIRAGSYSGEPLDIVKRTLMASDYLLIPQAKLKTYIQSISQQDPLLLYRLYKDKTMLLGAENWRLIRNQLASLSPFQLHQRLGVLDNQNPAVGHTNSVSSIAKLDDNTAITGSTDHTAIVWHKDDDGSWQMQQRLGAADNTNPAVGHTNNVSSIAKLDNNTAITASADHSAILWYKNADGVWQLQQRLGDARNQNPAVGHTDSVSSIAKLDDNTVITGSGDHTAILWHKNTDGIWQLQQRLGGVKNQNPAIGHTGRISSIAKLDDNTAITGSEDRTVILWHKNDDGTWQLQQRLGVIRNYDPAHGHTLRINSIAIIDNDIILTGSDDTTAILWHKDANGTWQLQQRLGVTNNLNPALGHISHIILAAQIDENTIITASSDNTAILWHKNTSGVWELLQRLGTPSNLPPMFGLPTWAINSFAKIDDNTFITGPFDNTAILWLRSIDRHWEPILQAQKEIESTPQPQPAAYQLKSFHASSRCNVM